MNYEQLKNSILQEAIEGRLVKQDPNDEPAAVLLDRIADEKKRLIKEKKIVLSKPEKKVDTTAEKDLEIPSSWVWCNINDVCRVFGRIGFRGYAKSDLRTSKEEGAISLSPSNMVNDKMVYYPCTYISFEKYEESPEIQIKNGDILIVKTGSSYGKTVLVEDLPWKSTINPQIAVIKDIKIDSKYLTYFLQSPYAQSKFKDFVLGTSIPTFSQYNLISMGFPLPPLSEQHRIVAKLEEVLPKVEEYGKAQDRLDTLNSVLPEKLKASILQEAIEGRLVPQNPDDEPASKLLDRIAEEKAKLVKEKKIKADKNASRIYRTDDGHWMEHFADKHRTDVCIDDDIPFDIPSNWRWSRLKEHCVIASGLGYKKENLETKSDQMIRVLRGGNVDYGKWQNKVNDIFISKEFVKDELLLKRGTFISPAVTSLEQMGKTALIEEDLPETVVGGFVLMITPFIFKDEYLHYLNAFFMSSYYKKQCQSITNKSGQAFYNLSRAKLLETLVPVPPIQEERRIDNILNEILPKLENILH